MSFKGGGGAAKPTKKTPAASRPTRGKGPVANPKAYSELIAKAKAKPVTQLQKTVGPVATKPTAVRKAIDKAGRANTAEAAKDADTVKRVVAAYKGKATTVPNPDDVKAAIRHGNAKVAGSYLLQKDAHLEVTDQGDIALKMNRRFLPDTTQIVVPGDYKPGYTKAQTKAAQARSRQVSAASDSIHSAGAKALEYTARPIHAVAAGTDAAIKGKNVPKAAAAGITGKDKTLFSDVLKHVGAPAGVAAVGGFALDVVADPTTYVTGGVGGIARKSAQKAALDAEKRALKAGLSKDQAAKMAARAHAQTIAKLASKDAKGLTVKVAGREVPGVRKATAKTAGRVVRKAGARAGRTRAGQGAKNVAGDVNPNMAPAGMTREAADKAAQVSRTARSQLGRDLHEVEQRAAAVRKQLGKDDSRVIDAIESGMINALPPDLKKAAVFLRSQFRYADRLRKQAGIKGGTRTNYVPHAPAKYLAQGKGIVEGHKPAGVGKRIITPGHTKARREGTIADLRKSDPGVYSEDLPLLYANRMQEGFKSVRQAELNRRLADTGTETRPGKAITLGDGESVYRVKGSDLKPLGKDETSALAAGKLPGGGGRYVVLNDRLIDRAMSAYKSNPSQQGIVRIFDKAQGTWKTVALATPGFHLRNLLGDSQNAYLAEPGHKLARNIQHSRRALKRLNKQENAQRTLGAEAKPSRLVSRAGMKADPKTSGLKINGKFMSYDELAKEAAGVGAIRSGFTSRELPELLTSNTGVKRVTKSKAGRTVSSGKRHLTRGLQNREDLLRLATYIGGRKRGLGAEAAAARAMKYHFDYAQLTDFERNVARRILPFYTWSARNIPLQAKSLVTKPGKYAQYEKVREEAAKAQGLDPTGYQNDLSEWEQRNLGIPLKIGGRLETLSFGSPITDLNELPVLKPGAQLDEWFQKSMSLLSPFPKDLIEWFSNYSYFFRGQLERDTGPLAAAPAWAAKLPAPVRKMAGVTHMLDRRTGKKVLAWRAKAGYIAQQLGPGPINQVNQLIAGTDVRGRGPLEKYMKVAGVTLTPVDPLTTDINKLYEQQKAIEKRRATLRQMPHPGNGRRIRADNPTPEYTKLLGEDRQIKLRLYKLSTKRGDSEKLGSPPPAGEMSPQEKMLTKLEKLREGSGNEQEQLLDKLAKMRGG